MSTISREIAENEVTKWLDYKKVTDSTKESYDGFSDKLISSMQNGNLVLDKEHNLIFTPVDSVKNKEGEVTVKEFKFKPRIRMKELRPYLTGVKSGDGDGRLLAYICALTHSPTAVVDELYSEDFAICEAIAIFFV